MMSGLRGLNHQRWLDAFSEPHASIYTFGCCMALTDLNADGDYKLIIADLGTGATGIKLKVYKGTSLMTELTLLDVPTGIVTFHMDLNEPHVPAIGVASGPNIYIYKNLKPYFKFSLPSLDMNPLEHDLWLEVRDKKLEVEVLYEMLQNVRQEVGFSNLTPRSQQLLLLERSKWQQFVSQHKDYPLKRQTVATCITTLKKCMSEDHAVSCLVVGTESGEIFMLDPEAFTILETMSLCGSGNDSSPLVPAQVAATGLYDVEYRVVTACRDGSVCLVRQGWKEAKVLAQLGAQVVDMIVQSDNASIVLATMDHSLHCYSKKGKKQWEVKLAAPVSTLTPLALPHVGTTLVCVALLGGAVHFYSGRQLCDVITASDTVSAMLFGRFGQEEHSLILVTVGGALLVKILKRTAHFVPQSSGPGLVPVQHIKMIIPKKSKLFVEQTMREREDSSRMHQTFHQDLLRLRLSTARSCVKALQSCSNPISSSSDEPLKISAQVLGLGPTFQIHLTLQNMSDNNRPSKDLAIVFHCDDKLYHIEEPYIQVPLLVPGLLYNFKTQVEYVSDVDVSDQVRILVVRQNSTQPLLAAAINMPACDILDII